MSAPFSSRLLLLMLACLPRVRAELVTDPVEVALEPGHGAEMTCQWVGEENSTKAETLIWTRVLANSSTAEVEVSNSSSVQVLDNTLLFQNVTFFDAGEYRCSDDAGTEHASSTLIVYNMPSYAVEGLVVGGLIVVLLVTLLIGLIIIQRNKRRFRHDQEKERERKRQRQMAAVNSAMSYTKLEAGATKG